MKSFAVVILLFTLSGSLFAQRQMLSPEQRTQQLKDSLALSEEQASGVLKIYQEMDVERNALFESGDGDRQSRMQTMRALSEKSDTRIEELLTVEQKEKYAEMKKRRQERVNSMRRRD